MTNTMSDYCNHIRSHCDPNGLTITDETAEEVWELLSDCFPREECPLTLADCQAYLDELAAEVSNELV